MLGRAPSEAQVRQGYQQFHTASGTVSRKEAIAASDNPFDTVSRAMETMKSAYGKLRDSTLTPQEAVEASQAGRLIRDMKSRGNEMAMEIADAAGELKGQFDDFIQQGSLAARQRGRMGNAYPEWKNVRQMAFEKNVADDFSSPWALNINGMPNQLRGYGSIAAAVTGTAASLATGHPGLAALAAVSPLLQSPLAYGMAIRGANQASKAAPAIGAAMRAGVGSIPAGTYSVILSFSNRLALTHLILKRKD